MTRLSRLILLAAVAAFLIGCNKPATSSAVSTPGGSAIGTEKKRDTGDGGPIRAPPPPP